MSRPSPKPDGDDEDAPWAASEYIEETHDDPVPRDEDLPTDEEIKAFAEAVADRMGWGVPKAKMEAGPSSPEAPPSKR
jgi:hypothetical protein